MKRLAVLAVMLLGACQQQPTAKVDKGGPGVAESGPAAMQDALANIERRLKALEQAHPPGWNTEQGMAERIQKLEGDLSRREDALAFLEMAYAQQKRQEEAQQDKEHDPNAVFAVDVSGPIKAGQSEGPNDALVTIVKAFDFACPYCEKLNAPLHELVKENNGKVRVVYMNMVVHPDTAQAAHLYSCAAAKQQKYSAWKDAFWEKGFKVYLASQGRDRQAMGEENILKLSGDIGLDTGKLKTEANGDDCKRRVQADMTELQKFRVSGTPALFINGKFVGGAIPKPQFQSIIDEKLKIAEASGVGGAEYYDKEIMGKGVRQFRSKRGQ